MNNTQFRNLLLDKRSNDTSSSRNGDSRDASKPTTTSSSSSLGTKKAAFMPMAPRTVRGGGGSSSSTVDFARQLRERDNPLHPGSTDKRPQFRTSAPKGSKFGAGYTDRAKARAEADGDGDGDGGGKAARVRALEEQMKLGQISSETFEALRDEITAGEIGSTHLVKGLDWKLLERVRRGEDVLGAASGASSVAAPDVDAELEKIGEKEVETASRERVVKKGTIAHPPSLAGKKRSRDEIMAELKAQRKAAAEAKAAPQLDGRWRKVGERERSRIEIDRKGREVLITVDEDGMVKKMVRKRPSHAEDDNDTFAMMPDENKAVLGADAFVPEALERSLHRADDEDNDDDIFDGVGAEYNPLGDEVEDGASSAEEDDSEVREKRARSTPRNGAAPDSADTAEPEPAPASIEKSAVATRNYFNDESTDREIEEKDRLTGVKDLLKKAAKMDPQRISGEDNETVDGEVAADKSRLEQRAQMLRQEDRDLEDMDMGFGGSRYDDGDDDGDSKVRLSEWNEAAMDKGELGEEDGKGGGGGKKKRKPKKRKGDANNAADIMRVIEGRKAAATK